MYDLIRTVEHLHEDGSEGVLEVRAMQTNREKENGEHGVAVVLSEYGEGGVIIHDFDQAERLHRAIKAALIKAGHEEPEL